MKVAVYLGLFAMLSAAPAMADDVRDIRGNWTFHATVEASCVFEGTALISNSELEGQYACELTARQSCQAPDGELFGWTVRQSCRVERQGNQVDILARVEEFLQGPPSARYAPDNFSLTIKNSNLMTGHLVSYGHHPAEWRREAGFTS